jgi:hypothetical protein
MANELLIFQPFGYKSSFGLHMSKQLILLLFVYLTIKSFNIAV